MIGSKGPGNHHTTGNYCSVDSKVGRRAFTIMTISWLRLSKVRRIASGYAAAMCIEAAGRVEARFGGPKTGGRRPIPWQRSSGQGA